MNRLAYIFSQIPGVGPKLFNATRRSLRDRGAGWQDLFDDPSLPEELRLPYRVAQALHGPHDYIERTCEELEDRGITIITAGSERYPAHLEESLADAAPPVLYVIGDSSLLETEGIAFSGARKATEEGLAAARELAREFAAAATVVSGMAQGIDTAAHYGALIASGATVAVLPHGILHFRPRRELRGEWEDGRYCVVSEFPPRQSWSGNAAMQRNRTIVALARVVLCFEPGVTGGTLETARIALRMRRPLFVVKHDGAADWRSTERLAARGATSITAADAGTVIAAFRKPQPAPRQGDLF